MPGKPFQSKLEPFYEFIRECRIKRWSYARIAESITSQHGMTVSANAVFSFVKVRVKGRKLYRLPPRAEDAGFPPSRGDHGPSGENLTGLAAAFFTPSDETSKPANEKRRYNLEY